MASPRFFLRVGRGALRPDLAGCVFGGGGWAPITLRRWSLVATGFAGPEGNAPSCQAFTRAPRFPRGPADATPARSANDRPPQPPADVFLLLLFHLLGDRDRDLGQRGGRMIRYSGPSLATQGGREHEGGRRSRAISQRQVGMAPKRASAWRNREDCRARMETQRKDAREEMARSL